MPGSTSIVTTIVNWFKFPNWHHDNMDTAELTYVTAPEWLASERIKEENCWGTSECYDASIRIASFISEAIEKDRADRAKRSL